MNSVPMCKVCGVAFCCQKSDKTYFPTCSRTCGRKYDASQQTVMLLQLCCVCHKRSCTQKSDGTFFPTCSRTCGRINDQQTKPVCKVCKKNSCTQKSDGRFFPTCSRTCGRIWASSCPSCGANCITASHGYCDFCYEKQKEKEQQEGRHPYYGK